MGESNSGQKQTIGHINNEEELIERFIFVGDLFELIEELSPDLPCVRRAAIED